MRSGQLRHVIKVQEKTNTIDGTGSTVTVWSDKFQTRAAIWPLKSKERLESMKIESEVTNKIRIRYRSGITSKERIKFGSRIFEIKGTPINPDERNIMLDILVTEII